MKLLSLLVGMLVVGGCTQRNPAKCSDNNHCPDQSLPFCDVDGTLGGEPQQCVAVNCTANELETCRGEQEIRCNATGDNFDVVKCELGCEGEIGCRLCEPNQTRCTNGKVGVCDADGMVVSTESCPLGCFLDEPRCRDIDPSNGLGELLDLVASKSDLTFENATIFTETGEVRDVANEVVATTSLLKASTTSAPPIRAFLGHNIRLKNVSIYRNQSERDGYSVATGAAVAFVATGDITIEGRIRVFGGAGGLVQAGCSGGAGFYEYEEGVQRYTGSGGGGHATAGASGGGIPGYRDGGVGGVISGTENLIPLRGGCSASGSSEQSAGPGGGAIQLSSRGAINVKGIVDARGHTPLIGGGGAGGGILLEAPSVTLDQSARLIVTGGGGGAGEVDDQFAVPTPPNDEGTPQFGTACAQVGSYCGLGGNGAAPGVPATVGGNTVFSTTFSSGGGGGGGGLGRIRINTPDRTYSKSNSALEAGVLSTGVLSTR